MSKKIILNYDFDNTLTTKFGQQFGFFQAIDTNNIEFWGNCVKLSKENNIEPLHAWMFLAKEEFRKRGKKLTNQTLRQLGENVEFYDGVLQYFDKINAFAKELGVTLEHNIVSANYKALIEGTKVAKYMNNIYGCELFYAEDDNVLWPANVITPETKVACLNSVSKGYASIFDNEFYLQSAIPENPFENMFYFGDSLQDLPPLLEMNNKGGKAVGVYNPEKQKIQELEWCKNNNLLDDYLPAEFFEGGKLFEYVKQVVKQLSEKN